MILKLRHLKIVCEGPDIHIREYVRHLLKARRTLCTGHSGFCTIAFLDSARVQPLDDEAKYLGVFLLEDNAAQYGLFETAAESRFEVSGLLAEKVLVDAEALLVGANIDVDDLLWFSRDD